MARFSIGVVWEETIAFLRRESGILIPVAMATFGVAAILFGFAVPENGASTMPVPSARLWLMVPVVLVMSLGNIAISLLALSPGISVADALRRGAFKVPTLIAAGIMLGVGFFGVLMFIGILASPFAGGSATALAVILSPIVGIMVIIVAVPTMFLAAVVAMEPASPVGALKRIVMLIKGNVARLFLVLCLMLVIMTMISVITGLVITTVTKLFALLVGGASLLALLGDVVMAAVSALLSMVVAAYIAFAYRRLAG